MRIVTVGRGHIGGGLASLWVAAGHDVIQLGRDGGDAASADAAQVTEQLIQDADFAPIHVGDLDHVPLLEQYLTLIQAVASAGLGPVFYRMAPPATDPLPT